MLNNEQAILRRLKRLTLRRITGEGHAANYAVNYFDMCDWQDRISETDFVDLNERGLLRLREVRVIPPYRYEAFTLTAAGRAAIR